MKLYGLKIGLVGPLPPPAGGMANQTRQLAELLEREGAVVTIVQVNLPCRPGFVERIRGLRALVRFIPYAARLWRVAGRTDLLHVVANSGWSWRLYAVPAIGIARLRGTPSVVNYRGGEAGTFLARSGARIAKTMRRASALVVPSGFLQKAFKEHGIESEIVPNIIDVERFRPAASALLPGMCRIVVTRNLEPIYDIPMALRAFSLVVQAIPGASLVVAGSGPELKTLRSLAAELGILGHVDFCGSLDRDQIAELYRSASLVLNPSRVDNMPNSVLEAMASGVPVVSTNVGGVPWILRHEITGLLVASGDHAAMAAAAARVLGDPDLASRLRAAALADIQQYTWPRIKQQWSAVYAAALSASDTRGSSYMIANAAPAGSLYTRMAANVLFPLHERLKGHNSVSVRRALEQSQWWTPERLMALQLQRLQALLEHANDHVPYYRTLFARLGFDPRSVRELGDLRAVPLLAKADIRANANDLKSGRAIGLARSNTGGSSGEPLIFFMGSERVSHDVAAKWRATRWWGVDIGDPEIVVWGSPIELGAQDRVRMLRDRIMRSELLPAFEMSESKLDEFIARIRHRRPTMLFGYPSSLALIARHAEKRGIAMNDLGVKVAFVTSERLYDHQRETIARIFGCRVANGYGGRDAGFIAHECPMGGMHITAEDVVVEIIDSKGNVVPPGVAGEVVTTHLATRDFPFIRYRTGDIAILDDRPCACGRGLPLLKEIQGRSTDFIVAADGTMMHGLALVYVIRNLSGIAAFRIIQESRALTRVQIVRGPGFEPSARQAIVEGLCARLGAGTEVAVEDVATIPPDSSGKYRYVVSKVTA